MWHQDNPRVAKPVFGTDQYVHLSTQGETGIQGQCTPSVAVWSDLLTCIISRFVLRAVSASLAGEMGFVEASIICPTNLPFHRRPRPRSNGDHHQ